ncbi:hypothetical protein [Asticcacaulis sp. AC402]|uniref:hypothetical protein n=1 Tax=Asticcacaulis sp. AC402 TaxID=1282361 RepID=UPI0004CED9CC|nr:hypothetical protein [Asticcacaulis sp. AC402]
MLASRIALALSLMLAVPCLAFAQSGTQNSDELVSANARARLPTQAELAASAGTETVTAKPITTDEQIIAWLNHAPRTAYEDRANALWPDRDAEGKRKVHGGAGVSIGTGGYRSGYVYTLIPIGDDGTLGLSYSQTDYGKNAGWGYEGYDGYPGYGDPGQYGHGYGRRGGTSQSFGLSLDLSGSSRDASGTPVGCAPGFRVGDRHTEPLWVQDLRGNRSCLDASEP